MTETSEKAKPVPQRIGLISRFALNRSGATAVEYALIAAILFLGIVASVSSIKQPLNEIFDEVAFSFESILGGG